MFKQIFTAFWFFLPAGLATSAADIAARIPLINKLDYPADFYLKYKGERLFGSHKTIRGFVVGIIVGITITFVQKRLFIDGGFIANTVGVNYTDIDPLILGTLLSFGALLGDSVKSFFKRRAGIKPGHSWFPFDQADYIIGGLFFSYFYVQLQLSTYLRIFIIYFISHLLTVFSSYLLKIRKDPI